MPVRVRQVVSALREVRLPTLDEQARARLRRQVLAAATGERG